MALLSIDKNSAVRNRDKDIENKCMDTRGGGMSWDIGIDLYTLLCTE